MLSSGSASDLGLSSSSLLPPTGLLQPTPSSSSSNQPGFMADFTAIKELDTVSTDIENVKKLVTHDQLKTDNTQNSISLLLLI